MGASPSIVRRSYAHWKYAPPMVGVGIIASERGGLVFFRVLAKLVYQSEAQKLVTDDIDGCFIRQTQPYPRRDQAQKFRPAIFRFDFGIPIRLCNPRSE